MHMPSKTPQKLPLALRHQVTGGQVPSIHPNSGAKRPMPPAPPQFLVVNCMHHGEAALEMLAVSAAPCGHCRQFYAELVHAVSPSALGWTKHATLTSASDFSAILDFRSYLD